MLFRCMLLSYDFITPPEKWQRGIVKPDVCLSEILAVINHPYLLKLVCRFMVSGTFASSISRPVGQNPRWPRQPIWISCMTHHFVSDLYFAGNRVSREMFFSLIKLYTIVTPLSHLRLMIMPHGGAFPYSISISLFATLGGRRPKFPSVSPLISWREPCTLVLSLDIFSFL
jgi:hypothetical protein